MQNFKKFYKHFRPELQKNNSKCRKCISPEERLTLTLRFLASGDSQISMNFSYRVPSTGNSIILITCETIWKTLSEKELPTPIEELWKEITNNNSSIWQFPNCIGAIIGKHIQMQAPRHSGSLFFGYYFYFFSIVLLALVDTNYEFVVFNIGGYGKSRDGVIFQNQF